MPKKKWERPKLIVLVRSRPEEVVLSYCKGMGGSADPSSGHGPCVEFTPLTCPRTCEGTGGS